MTLTLKAQIQKVAENEFIASIVGNEKFRGMVVQARSEKEAQEELLTSVRVKMAFDYGIEINSIKDGGDEDDPNMESKSEKFDLVLL